MIKEIEFCGRKKNMKNKRRMNGEWRMAKINLRPIGQHNAQIVAPNMIKDDTDDTYI